jgi:hypothetical protein
MLGAQPSFFFKALICEMNRQAHVLRARLGRACKPEWFRMRMQQRTPRKGMYHETVRMER